MPEFTINSDTGLQEFIGVIREDYRKHHYIRASWKNGKDRSKPQNDISHAWYGQIARELRENDELGWKCFCKLTIGVPILRAEDEEFRLAYDSVIKPLSYENKIIAMRCWPVTSIMKKPQLSQYLELMQDYFQKLGVYLVFSETARLE